MSASAVKVGAWALLAVAGLMGDAAGFGTSGRDLCHRTVEHLGERAEI